MVEDEALWLVKSCCNCRECIMDRQHAAMMPPKDAVDNKRTLHHAIDLARDGILFSRGPFRSISAGFDGFGHAVEGDK